MREEGGKRKKGVKDDVQEVEKMDWNISFCHCI